MNEDDVRRRVADAGLLAAVLGGGAQAGGIRLSSGGLDLRELLAYQQQARAVETLDEERARALALQAQQQSREDIRQQMEWRALQQAAQWQQAARWQQAESPPDRDLLPNRAWINGQRAAPAAPVGPNRADPLGSGLTADRAARLRALVDRWVPRDGSTIDPLNGRRLVNMAEVTELCRAVGPLLDELDGLRAGTNTRRDWPPGSLLGAETDIRDEDARADLRRLAAENPPLVGGDADPEAIATLMRAVVPLLDELDRLDELLLGALTVRPCHLEAHASLHAAGTLCEEQVNLVGLGLVAGLGLAPSWLPRELHADGCGACDPTDPRYRDWLETGALAAPDAATTGEGTTES